MPSERLHTVSNVTVQPRQGLGTLDHLVITTVDLAAACDECEARLGVRPEPGGTHPDLRLGVSTRGTLTMLRVARAYAATADRGIAEVVEPDVALSRAGEVPEGRVDRIAGWIWDKLVSFL